MPSETLIQDEKFQALVTCFRQVFPNVSPNAIPAAEQDAIASWDSVAHVTLLSLIGEKFGVDIDFDEFAEATSFASVLRLIRASGA